MERSPLYSLVVRAIASAACGGNSSTGSAPAGVDASALPTSSEVATSVVSGAVNDSAGTTLGWRLPRAPDAPAWRRVHGASTGWDSSVSPAPSDGGLVITCGASGCSTGGGRLAIDGSHVVGTVTSASGGPSFKIWDHTGSTAGGPLVLTVSSRAAC